MPESDEYLPKPVERPNDVGGTFRIKDPWYETTTNVRHGGTGLCVGSLPAGPDKQFDIKFDVLTLRFEGGVEGTYRRYELIREDAPPPPPAV